MACLVEPLAVALHGVHRAGVVAGTRVLVIGAGPIGLCAVAAARCRRGRRSTCWPADPARIAGRPSGSAPARRSGTDYDVVLDAAGTQSSLDQAIERVRPGGTIGVLANFWEPVAVGMGLQIKEVTLVPSFTYGHHHQGSEFDQAVQILVDIPDLAGRSSPTASPWTMAAEAFRVAADRTRTPSRWCVHP